MPLHQKDINPYIVQLKYIVNKLSKKQEKKEITLIRFGYTETIQITILFDLTLEDTFEPRKFQKQCLTLDAAQKFLLKQQQHFGI